MTMTTDAATADSTTTADADTGADEHESHDVTDRQYIVIALLLAVLTAAEVAVSYMDIGGWLVPTLLIMMSIKFFTIVGYFMHLKFDSPLFKMMFYIGLGMALALFGVMLTTFHFFIT